MLETEEQNHEEELKKARKEKWPERYDQGMLETKEHEEIEKAWQQKSAEERYNKEIVDVPFAICDDVERYA